MNEWMNWLFLPLVQQQDPTGYEPGLPRHYTITCHYLGRVSFRVATSTPKIDLNKRIFGILRSAIIN